MRLVPLLLLLAAFHLAAADGARAAQANRGVVVASLPGAELRARDADDRGLCLELGAPDAGGGSSTCGPIPRLGRYGSAQVLYNPDQTGSTTGGAVPPEVARVTVVPDSGEPVSVDTVAGGAYRGRAAGRVRFFLAALPGAPAYVEYRLLAADGTLLAVEEGEDQNRPPVLGPVRVGALRDGRRRLRVEAETIERLDPNLVDPGHRERLPCLVLRVGREPGEGEQGRACLSRLRDGVNLDVRTDCSPARTYVVGFLEAGERSATVVLGSGRRVRPRTFSLPAAGGGGRGWAIAVPAGEAVRRVEIAGGTPAGLSLPPAGSACRASEGSSAFSIYSFAGPGERFGGPVTPDAPLAVAGSGGLLAADAAGGGLCLTFERGALRTSDCLPIARGDEGRVVFGALREGRRAAGGVTALRGARTAVVRFTDGATAAAPIGDPPAGGYAGGYRGKARFWAVEAATTGRVDTVTLRDAAGKALSVTDVEAPFGRLGPVRRLAGAPPLFTAPIRARGLGTTTSRSICVALRRPRSGIDCLSVDGTAESSLVLATCGPRTATVVGRAPRRADRVELVLAGGARRRVAIRPGGLYAARLAAGEGLRAVVVRMGRRASRTPYLLPPAREQCGYGSYGSPVRPLG